MRQVRHSPHAEVELARVGALIVVAALAVMVVLPALLHLAGASD